jgi:tetratricopeptide (TPR) repeat protein
MGVVYRAENPDSGEQVAVKLPFESDPRFEQESQALAQLDHPGVVGFREAFTDDAGRQALVMEWVEGETLQQRLSRDGPPRVDKAVRLAIELSQAVEHAHQRGVLHRDLKPSNVVIDAGGRLRLTDFGLGKLLPAARRISQASLTRTGELMGTPAYMAPEQAAGEKARVGPRSDVYGLGATLYALLTGRPPFKGVTPLNTLNAVFEEAPLPPSTHRAEVPAGLDAVVLRCLAKEPDERFPSAAALSQALEPWATPASRVRTRTASRAPWVAAVCVVVGVGGAAAILNARLAQPPDATPDTAPLLAQADALKRAEDWPALEAVCTQALELDPGLLAAYRRRCMARLGLGDLKGAEADARSAVRLGPRDWRARSLLGSCLGAQGQPQASLEVFQEAIALAPREQQPELLLFQSWALYGLGQMKEALPLVEEALAIHREVQGVRPRDDSQVKARADLHTARAQMLLDTGRIEEAIAGFDRAIELTGSPEARIQRADAYLRQGGREKEALAELAHVIDTLPNDPLRALAYSLRARHRQAMAQALGARGRSRLAREALLQARDDYDASAQLATTPSPRVAEERAQVLALLGDYEHAAEAYAQALKLAPRAELHIERAVVLDKLGRADEALADMARAIELDPHSQDNRLGAALLAMRHDRLERARAELDALVAAGDTSDGGSLRHMRGLVRVQLGDVAGAKTDWERARVQGSHVLELPRLLELAAAALAEDDVARSRLEALSRGIMLEGANRNPEALALYARLLEEAADPLVYARRGLLLRQLRRLDEAEQALSAALERAAAGPAALALTALAARGEVYLDRGDAARARADFQRAQTLTPTTAAGFLARAGAHMQLEDHAAAIADCDRALELNPRQGRAWQLRGMARAARGELQGAVADLERALGASLTQQQRLAVQQLLNRLRSGS